MKTTIVYKKNLQAFTGKYKIIVNEGGSSSSKTYSILQLFITLLFNPEIKNKTFSVVSESLPHLVKGAMKDFFDILRRDNLYTVKNHNRTRNEYNVGSNVIQFFGVEDEQKVRGPRRDFCFINECNNVKYETFKQLNMRTMNTMFLDFNPVQEFWVHQQLLGTKWVGYIHSTYLDNLEFTPKKIQEDLERMKETDPNGYRVYALGLVGSLDGLIFPTFNILEEYVADEKDSVIFGLDFGFTNDSTALVSVLKKEIEGVKHLFIDEVIYQVGLTNEDISNMMESYGLRKHYDKIIADSAEPKSIEELYRRGWNIHPCSKGPDSIIKGIDEMKQYKLNVTKRSVNLIKELRNYSWMKDRDGRLINKPVGSDHLVDGIRYALGSLGIMGTSNFKIKGLLKF